MASYDYIFHFWVLIIAIHRYNIIESQVQTKN